MNARQIIEIVEANSGMLDSYYDVRDRVARVAANSAVDSFKNVVRWPYGPKDAVNFTFRCGIDTAPIYGPIVVHGVTEPRSGSSLLVRGALVSEKIARARKKAYSIEIVINSSLSAWGGYPTTKSSIKSCATKLSDTVIGVVHHEMTHLIQAKKWPKITACPVDLADKKYSALIAQIDAEPSPEKKEKLLRQALKPTYKYASDSMEFAAQLVSVQQEMLQKERQTGIHDFSALLNSSETWNYEFSIMFEFKPNLRSKALAKLGHWWNNWQQSTK